MMDSPAAEILPPEQHEPLPPLRYPLLVSDSEAWVPSAFVDGCFTLEPICKGLDIAWTPVPEIGGLILILPGGNPKEPTGEVLVTQISREGLRGLISGLQSIDAQLGES